MALSGSELRCCILFQKKKHHVAASVFVGMEIQKEWQKCRFVINWVTGWEGFLCVTDKMLSWVTRFMFHGKWNLRILFISLVDLFLSPHLLEWYLNCHWISDSFKSSDEFCKRTHAFTASCWATSELLAFLRTHLICLNNVGEGADLGVYFFCVLTSGSRFEPSSCLRGSKLQDITPITFRCYEIIQSEVFSQGVLLQVFFFLFDIFGTSPHIYCNLSTKRQRQSVWLFVTSRKPNR